MTIIDISPLRETSLYYLYSEKDSYDLEPLYQRQSGIWTRDKKQLLIDSVINGYDVPKIYFHRFVKPQKKQKKLIRYAIVDGKQRLKAIWDFMDNKFALSDQFKYVREDGVEEEIDLSGLTYSDLGKKHPRIKARFDGSSLDIIAITTDDIELIEDMFSRLNEAVPLNAAEKRNAWGGSLPPVIRALSKHIFFTDCLPFPNTRYRHFDIAAKFLYVEEKDGVTDTKKAYLDNFVLRYSESPDKKKATSLKEAASSILDSMRNVFTDSDSLLRSVGMVTLYYLLFRNAVAEGWHEEIDRGLLKDFEDLRARNKETAEEDITKAEYDLIEFDSFSQSPNDAIALRYRLEVLTGFFVDRLGLEYVE
ncbi:MAG: DUF262 domain-containing protein [Candidatus Paceibacterota bacterium]